MVAMQILLIEDENHIAEALQQALAASYSVHLSETGTNGLLRAASHSYDIVILDLNLPDVPGLHVCL